MPSNHFAGISFTVSKAQQWLCVLTSIEQTGEVRDGDVYQHLSHGRYPAPQLLDSASEK